MRVLVTGGTGRVGASIVRELVARGHAVHVLTRRAPTSRETAPLNGVEYVVGDFTDARSLRGATDRCAAIVHAASIRRDARRATLHATNIEGTRHLLDEARRAGAPWVVYLSRLGADRVATPMLRSHRHAEMLVRELAGAWLVLRPSTVYGPGIGPIAAMLEVVRQSPVMPISVDADARVQPMWIDDLAQVVARAVERRELAGRSIDIAGDDCVTIRALHAMMNALLDRRTMLFSASTFIADAATQLISALRMSSRFDQRDVRELQQAGPLLDVRWNPVRELFGIDPTSLSEGLRAMANMAGVASGHEARPPAVHAPPGVV